MLSFCVLSPDFSLHPAEAGWVPARLTAVAFQYLRGDAAVWQLEEAVRREFFSLWLTGKKTPPKQMSHKTESLALCTPAHLLNNILTPFVFFSSAAD